MNAPYLSEKLGHQLQAYKETKIKRLLSDTFSLHTHKYLQRSYEIFFSIHRKIQLTTVLIFLESLAIFHLTLPLNNLEILTTEQRHIVLCVDNIIHRHLLPKKSLRVSPPPVYHNVTSPTFTYTHLQEYNFNMFDILLRIVTEDAR